MSAASPQALTIPIDDGASVSALLQVPPQARALYVFAHGAGAGMAHPFMAAIANGLADHLLVALFEDVQRQLRSRKDDHVERE